MDLTIRPGKPGDEAVLADFNARLAAETESRELDRELLLKGVSAVLRDPARGAYHVAECDGGIVGQLLITFEWSDWRNGNFWWIQSVYVREDFRGRGVFRALLKHVQQLASSQPEVCGLRLYVETNNARARTVYDKLGFRHTEYEMFEQDFVLDHKPARP